MPSPDILLRSKLKLGKQLLEARRFDEARPVYEQICARRRQDVDSWFTLGAINGMLGRHADVVRCCSKVVELDPRHGVAWYNLGIALRDTGQTEQAAVALRQAMTLNPNHSDAATSLGYVLIALQHYEEAEAVFRSLLDCQQGNAEFYAIYGSAMQSMGRYEAAIQAYRKGIELGHPRLAELQENLAAALCMQGRYQESIEMYDAALAREPNNARIHSSLLLTLHYLVGRDPGQVFDSHRCWPGNALQPVSPTPGFPAAERPGRLRIGYVSSDLRRHSVAYFLESLLEHHDAERFEVSCYFSHKDGDATTERLKGLVQHWNHVAELDDQQLLRKIVEDRIDILVDLNGHTSGGRLPVFARRAAPVQVSCIGYPDTTGLVEMDYRLIDAITDPPGADDFCTETLVRLPGCFLCYRPPETAPDVALAPCASNGFVTFGSFNNLAKVNPGVVRLWAGLLQALPGSRLLMKNPSLADTATRERYLAQFAEAGISGDRIDLMGFVPGDSGHLGVYGRVDIALDTFPYNGTTTTCEALWMGVPVVCLRGDRHSARVSASLLAAVGHPEWIGETPGQYQEIACRLARDMDGLARIRSGLRSEMRQSLLCDGEAYARAVETAFDHMVASRKELGTSGRVVPGDPFR